jgi:hypothetical protein
MSNAKGKKELKEEEVADGSSPTQRYMEPGS